MTIRLSHLAFFTSALAVVAACVTPAVDLRPRSDLEKLHPVASTNARYASSASSAAIAPPQMIDSAESAQESTATPLSLEERLGKRSVTDDKYARAELYSWTTPDQASALRKTKVLLVATAKTRGAPSPFNRLLNRLAAGQGQTSEFAKLLAEHPGLTKRRYAWSSPFATAVPLGERSYGHVLVRIVLKNESFLAKLDPLLDEPFAFVDMNNTAVPAGEVLQHPERIGAIFHVRRKPEGGPKFREYIVCNEAMIARWSLGTAHERAVVAEESALIADLRASPLGSILTNNAVLDAAGAWTAFADKPSLLDAWRAAIAFDSPKYKPSPKTLDAIATSLAAYDPAGEGVDHVPSASFPVKP